MSVSENFVRPASSPLARGNPLTLRRLAFAGLNLVTMAVLIALAVRLFGTGGMTWAEWGMLAGFALTVPWNVLGFWNALVGFCILRFARDPVGLVNPLLRRPPAESPVQARIAIAMCVRNEGTERVFRHLRLIEEDLRRAGAFDAFDMFVLSDTWRAEIARLEEESFELWRSRSAAPQKLHYRRRSDNAGYKAGNLRDFCERWGSDYDHLVVLDADSLMSAEAILRLIRTLEANPALGILQTLPVGLPSRSLFARVFQFGMRQTMRTFATGSAWWQGDCGPYWGHNAAIRLKPFVEHCRLPKLPGGPPLGGHVMSHDQIEAVLMRRAGYEVRVVPEEGGSYEENPTSLPEFIKRDLRWCQGNMQYLQLLSLPGLRPVSRVQIWIALFMYFGAPGWLAFIAFALAQGLLPPSSVPFPVGLGLILFWTILAMVLTPLALGAADILVSAKARRRYGGTLRVLGGTAAAMLFSTLLAPVMALAQTILMTGFLFGKTIRWEAQNRDTHHVPLRESLRGLWPQLLLGLAYGALLVWIAPGALPWAAPLLAGLVLAVPFSTFTASAVAGRFAERIGLCAIPEEFDRVPLVDAAVAESAAERREVALASR